MQPPVCASIPISAIQESCRHALAAYTDKHPNYRTPPYEQQKPTVQTPHLHAWNFPGPPQLKVCRGHITKGMGQGGADSLGIFTFDTNSIRIPKIKI